MNGLPGGAVTFVFTDIEGSTRLVKALRERYPQILADHRRLIRAAVAAHDGHEVDTQGDAFFVVFAGAKQAVLCGLVELGVRRLKDLDRPVRLFHLAAPGLDAPAGLAAAPRARRRGRPLPAQLTGFVGRERELGEVAGLLERDRLVTLAGPGGCGKTRLAVAVAGRLLPQFDDGVFFVPLAPVADPQMVASTIAGVLGVREGPDLPVVAAVEEQLRDRRSLLVLDNFEHLL